jgi:hypothetical protein
LPDLTVEREEQVKSAEEIMQILEAIDLTSSYRDAGELAGCSHHTVAAWVAKRDAGHLPVPGEPERRPRVTDPYLPKLEEWVERSSGRVRADVAYKRLCRLGFAGSERSVRRAVSELKDDFRRGRHRVYRPWLPEPGMWAQWDWGQGPLVGGRRANLSVPGWPGRDIGSSLPPGTARCRAARLGHSDPRLTLAVYAQATTEADKSAAKLLGTHFLGASRTQRARQTGTETPNRK